MPGAQSYSITQYREKGKYLRMLFLWKGSVYRMVWDEIIIWIIAYYSLNLVYRFVLNDDQQLAFEHVVTDFENGISFIPLSFVLGFYVSIVVGRYWSMWDNLPRPEGLALRIAASIGGKEQRDEIIRKTCMRYIILAIVLAYRKICKPVLKAYPDLDSIIRKGLLREDEKELLLKAAGGDAHPPFWMPLTWVASVFETARRENRIKDDPAASHLLTDLANFRGACSKTMQVDLIGLPLAYSQVVILALYTFWVGSVIARQSVESANVSKENYFPFFTILQLVIFIGWLAVAESMIHPFGEDDDDFQLVWMIDNHISSTYKMIDTPDQQQPALTEDSRWNEVRDNKGSPNSTRGQGKFDFSNFKPGKLEGAFIRKTNNAPVLDRASTIATIDMKNPNSNAW